MSQSLSRVLLHIVYSTKNRTPWLGEDSLRAELYAYNASILKAKADSPAVLINGMEDHIHILCQLSRKIAIMDLIKARNGKRVDGGSGRQTSPTKCGRGGGINWSRRNAGVAAHRRI